MTLARSTWDIRALRYVFAAGVLLSTTAQAQQADRALVAMPSSDLPDAPLPASQPAALNPTAAAATSSADETSSPTLKGLPARFLRDEVHIFTSPARLRKADLTWLLPLAGATAASFATDSYTMRNVVSRDAGFNSASVTTSDVLRGVAIGVPVLMYVAGGSTKQEQTRDTGMLAGEAMIDAYVFSEVVKYATLRERPAKNNANGRFYTGDAVSDPSFVSGHSIVTWSSAAVLACQYHRPWQQIGIYTLASGASLTRVLGQQHFPTDALLGSAAGWLIGHYVARAHHRKQ